MKDTTPVEVTFLGTGTSTGVPVIACDCPVCKSADPRDKRLRTSIRIKSGENNYIIDCGPDFRYQMIRVNVTDIDAILLTHQHRDHIAGLDDVRAFNYVLNKSMELYCTRQVFEAIQSEFPYIFTSMRFFGAPQINIHLIQNTPFNINGDLFEPILVKHGKMDVFGYRLRNFTYITDASAIEKKELEKVVGTKVLVINALRKSRHVSHFSLDEAIEIIQYIKPEKAYITHISHFMGIHEEVNNFLPKNIELAYDGLVIKID